MACKAFFCVLLPICVLSVAIVAWNPPFLNEIAFLPTNFTTKIKSFIANLTTSSHVSSNSNNSHLTPLLTYLSAKATVMLGEISSSFSGQFQPSAHGDVCYKHTWKDVLLKPINEHSFPMFEKFDEIVSFWESQIEKTITIKQILRTIAVSTAVLILLNYLMPNGGKRERRRITDLGMENDTLQLQVHSSREIERDLRNQLTALLQERNSILHAAEQANRAVDRLLNDRSQLESQNQSLITTLNQYSNLMQLKYNENQSLRSKLKDLELQCQELQLKVDENDALRTENTNLSKQSSIYGVEVAKLRQKNENLLKENCKLKKLVSGGTSEINKLRCEIEKLTIEQKHLQLLKQGFANETANETVFRLSEEIKLLKQDKNSFKNRLSNACSKLDGTTKEKHEAIIRSEATAKYFQEELASLRKKLEEKEQLINEYKANARKAEEEKWLTSPPSSSIVLAPPPKRQTFRTRRTNENRWLNLPSPLAFDVPPPPPSGCLRAPPPSPELYFNYPVPSPLSPRSPSSSSRNKRITFKFP